MKKKVISILLTLCIVLNLLPSITYAATKNSAEPSEGWHYLRCMGNYVNIDAKGNVELRDKSNTKEGNAKFRIHSYGLGTYGFELEDGRYLGLGISEDEMFKNPSLLNGQRLKAVNKNQDKYMTSWNVFSENNYDIFNIRPRMLKDYAVNASGEKREDGTPIITWEHIDRWLCPAYQTPDAPSHAEFRFIPVLPAVFKVKINKTPYRDKANGKILGELGSGTRVWVTKIDGDWATVKYKGKTYYMWAKKLKTVNPTIDAPIILRAWPTKTKYKVGGSFDIKGLNVVDITGGKDKKVNNKITFYMSEVVNYKDGYGFKKPVKIKPGYKFKKKGEALIEMKYKGVIIQNFYIEVK